MPLSARAHVPPRRTTRAHNRCFAAVLAYAAGHGPVALHERQLGAVGSPPDLGIFEVRLGLTERGFPTARRLPIARF